MSDLFYESHLGIGHRHCGAHKVGKGAAIYIEGVPPDVLRLPYNKRRRRTGHHGRRRSATVHMNDFVITRDTDVVELAL